MDLVAICPIYRFCLFDWSLQESSSLPYLLILVYPTYWSWVLEQKLEALQKSYEPTPAMSVGQDSRAVSSMPAAIKVQSNHLWMVANSA